MIFKWETKRERLLRFMSVPPKQKLELLRQMNEFIAKFSSARQMRIRQKLRSLK